LPQWQRRVRYGIPVTSAARTLVDLATKGAGQASTTYKLEKAWDDAERRNLLSDEEVERCVATVRGVSKQFLELLELRVAPCDGALAKDVLKLILEAGIAHPELEYEVAPEGENKVFHLDMAWPDQMVAVEVEGWEAHRQRGPFDHDAGRAAILTATGWSILPVTSRTKTHLPRRLRRALAARTMKAS
ncbi:MAG TPA: hypothetical protein VK975_06830, partial [Acidimicrobiales bacterium]|nr:hypothetical protein [Acidimicrobiales bacterium]